MEKLIDSLQDLASAGWEVVVAVLVLLVPWTPLIAWVGFWLLAVNWAKLYPILAKGGAIGVLLIGLMMILVWGLIAPPPDGVHHLFGLKPSNFVGKTVYVTMLLTITALCGTVQLSGACGSLANFPDEQPDEHEHDHMNGDRGHGENGHDGHGSPVDHSH